MSISSNPITNYIKKDLKKGSDNDLPNILASLAREAAEKIKTLDLSEIIKHSTPPSTRPRQYRKTPRYNKKPKAKIQLSASTPAGEELQPVKARKTFF